MPPLRSTPGSPVLERRVLAASPRWPGSQRRDPAAQALADDAPGDVGDALGREAELLEDRAGRRRRAEVVEPDDRALVADPALPAERDAASTLTRLRTAGGRTASRYAWSWASNRSQQGSDTTRVGMPSASSASAAANGELQLRAGRR